ncbi:unnamed protein product [Moneuplotes crassus]|uniref:Uncharacterized protein n=1 Tax=Euplotes crassus TaxID=5936 RepID=A0AAD1Y242_EUPCR|nr:unnamed protein product [Moneuplotes crassus]
MLDTNIYDVDISMKRIFTPHSKKEITRKVLNSISYKEVQIAESQLVLKMLIEVHQGLEAYKKTGDTDFGITKSQEKLASLEQRKEKEISTVKKIRKQNTALKMRIERYLKKIKKVEHKTMLRMRIVQKKAAKFYQRMREMGSSSKSIRNAYHESSIRNLYNSPMPANRKNKGGNSTLSVPCLEDTSYLKSPRSCQMSMTSGD